VKVALVRDAAFFDWIEAHADALARGRADALDELVRRSAELHLGHIADGGDPFEQGSGRPLDFGHWAAHKLESLSQHRLRHGEAVAIGLAIDCWQSHLAQLLDERSLLRVLDLLLALDLPTWDDALALRDGGRRLVVDGLAEFREHLGGELCITLLSQIGRGVDTGDVPPARVEAAIAALGARPPLLQRAGG
jgi:3-dehydroquinate synthase